MNPPINVLFIEDNPGDARLVKEELLAASSKTIIHLEWVDRLEKGLERLASNHIEAVLLDLSLPDSQGLATLQRVLTSTPSLPVIVMTGQADEAVATQAVQAGAQDYLIKGQVDGRLLIRCIQYAIQRKQSEMQLADTLEFTERILTSSPIGILTYRLTGKCLSANAYAAQMIGTSIEGLKSQNFRELESWKKSGLYHLAEKAIVNRTLTASDVHIVTTFGKEVWFQAQFVTFKSAGEELLLLILSDITERKRIEGALRDSEENYRQLFEAESDAIFLIENRTGQILQTNHAACVLYGYSQEELLTKKNIELSAEPEQTSHVTEETPLIADQVITIPLRFHRKKDGTVFPVEITGRFFLHLGRPVHIAAIRDITERKRAEAELAQTNNLLSKAEQVGHIGSWAWDIAQDQVVWSDGLYRIFGLNPEEFGATYDSYLERVHPQDREYVGRAVGTAYREGGTFEFESRIVRADGEIRVVYARGEVILNDSGEAARLLGIAVDITERKQAEIALGEKERRLSEAQHIGHIGSWDYNIPADVLQYSDEMYRLFDVSPPEFQHNREGFLKLIYSADRPEVTRWMELISSGRQVKEMDFRLFRKNGELRYIQSRGAVEFDSTGKPVHFIGTAQDITERKLAEIQIRQQLERLSALRRIDQKITSNFDLRVTLSTLLLEVSAQLQVDAADILLLNPDGQMLEYAAGRGFRTRTNESARVPLGESYAGQAAKERRLVRVENLKDQSHGPMFTTLFAEENFVCYYGVPLITKGKVIGVLEIFHRVLLQPYPEWLDFLNTLAGLAAIAIENATLFENLERSNRELSQAYDATIEGWSRAMDLRDRETEGHTQRVTKLTIDLARAMGMDESQLIHIRRGALLHDIGKLGIPDHILFKPGKLTEEERQRIKQHTEFAYEMLSPIQYLKLALNIPYFHHEKWDGTGYPLGLKGEEIPLEARIFALVDVWDALLSDRSYRKAWTHAETIDYIGAQTGAHFDPRVVECFLKMVNKGE